MTLLSIQGLSETSSSPPAYEAVARFVARYAAKLPVDTLANRYSLPPYAYSGCDYALVLHACLPHCGIDLSALCWGATPLRTQLHDNLMVFCEAARALRLPDTPLDALTPSALCPAPTCTMEHIKVQHWLYTLGRRFPPAPDHDSLQVRLAECYAQLGEPMLKRRRQRGLGGEQRNDSASESVHNYVNDPDALCLAPAQTECVSKMTLQTYCAPSLAKLPSFTLEQEEEVNTAAVAQGDGRTESTLHDITQPKRRLSYSRPWRVARIDGLASQARSVGDVKAAGAQKGTWHDAYMSRAAHLLEQSSMARRAANEMHTALQQIRAEVWQRMLTSARVDFASCLQQLRDISTFRHS